MLLSASLISNKAFEIAISIVAILIVVFIAIYIIKFGKRKNKSESDYVQNNDNEFTTENKHIQNERRERKYVKKQAFLTYPEQRLFDNINIAIKEFDLICFPQVNLASVVEKVKDFDRQYQNELYRNIDFGIFNQQTYEPILMIELNDSTHIQRDRYIRDLKVREILNSANIPLITLYTDYPNNSEYILKRIKEKLQK